MELHIHIDDGHKITVGDLRRLEEGDWNTIYSIVARFAVDEDGKSIDPEIASKMFDGLDIYQMKEITKQLREGLKALAFPLAASNS